MKHHRFVQNPFRPGGIYPFPTRSAVCGRAKKIAAIEQQRVNGEDLCRLNPTAGKYIFPDTAAAGSGKYYRGTDGDR